TQMTELSRDAETQLIEKMKVAFAQYYTAYEAIRQTGSLHGTVHSIAQTARDRYALGRGSQQEALKAEAENTRVATEIARLEATLKAARGHLNALLVRPLDAPLAKPARPRPLPDAQAFD